MIRIIGIYRIVNMINGKNYIGQSIDIGRRIEQRKKYYRSYSGIPFRKLYNAFYEYGLENFGYQILETCVPEQLNDREMVWVNYLNTFKNGYNMTTGGGGFGAGESSPSAKLIDEEVIEIKNLLLDKEVKIKDIATKYDVSESVISSINTGNSWSHIDKDVFNYPIRSNPYEINLCIICNNRISYNNSSGKCRSCGDLERIYSRSTLTKDKVSEAKVTLKNNPSLTIREISQMLNISYDILRNINYGKSWKNVDKNIYTYPIKDVIYYIPTCTLCGKEISYKSSTELCKICLGTTIIGEDNPTAKLTKEEVFDIKRHLKYHNHLSMNTLAKKYNISRTSISRINMGESWESVIFENGKYPLR